MSYLKFIIKHMIDMPKTIWYNFKILPLKQAIRLPILFTHNTKIAEIHKGSIEIDADEIRPFGIKIGIKGVEGISSERKSYIFISNKSKIIFKGKATLTKGISIRATGEIIFGKNFYSNCNLSIVCGSNISIGNNVLLGWNVHIRDCDGHSIYKDGIRVNPSSKIIIGNKVWVGQDVKLLKGISIGNDSVIAMNSCVTKSFEDNNIVIGGYPAKIINTDIKWEV